MSFEAYLLRGFEHPHESEMFAALVKALQSVFESLPGRHVMIGNVMFDGNDIDCQRTVKRDRAGSKVVPFE